MQDTLTLTAMKILSVVMAAVMMMGRHRLEYNREENEEIVMNLTAKKKIKFQVLGKRSTD